MQNPARPSPLASFIAVALLGSALVVGSPPAHATVIFTLGNNPQQPSEENILFGSSQTATTITGATNQSNTPVQFTSTQSLTTGGIGQAFIQATTGLETNFTFTVPGHTFGDLIFNPMIGGQPTGGGGTATVTAMANDGTFPFNYTLGNGNNFLTITTSGGETISSVSVNVTGPGFDQLQQPRVSELAPVSGQPVPEPASLALFGTALVGLGFIRRRKPS